MQDKLAKNKPSCDDEISLVDLIVPIVKCWKMLMFFIGLGVALSVAVAYKRSPKRY